MPRWATLERNFQLNGSKSSDISLHRFLREERGKVHAVISSVSTDHRKLNCSNIIVKKLLLHIISHSYCKKWHLFTTGWLFFGSHGNLVSTFPQCLFDTDSCMQVYLNPGICGGFLIVALPGPKWLCLLYNLFILYFCFLPKTNS